MKKNALRLIAGASVAYTLWFYLGALKGIKEGSVVADFSFYPILAVSEGILLLLAGAIPLYSTFSGNLMKNKLMRWIGISGITYGILISMNFYLQMRFVFSEPHLKIGLRLASWIALALLTNWKVKELTSRDSQHPGHAWRGYSLSSKRECCQI